MNKRKLSVNNFLIDGESLIYCVQYRGMLGQFHSKFHSIHMFVLMNQLKYTLDDKSKLLHLILAHCQDLAEHHIDSQHLG